ncbi:MAG: hypothetical protein SOV57_05675 [Bacilli bacterium]|nr:hypothetical protein [Erysipelotrichaceae bacterium]MDY2746671.1 hypothetical protein [Bacilli bacterium]
MNNKEMIEYRIKEEGKEEFLTFDEANNLVFYFDFPASMISYFYKGKDGRIRSNIKVEIVLKDEDSFVGLNHISSSTSLYKLLQDTIDNAYKRTIYGLIKRGHDPLDLQVEDNLIFEELKKDSSLLREHIEVKSLLLSHFEIETIQSTPKKSGGKRLLIAYIVICLILAIGAIVAVIWFYKYYLEGILSSSGI